MDRLVTALESVDAGIVALPFDMKIALAAKRIPRDEVPDFPDRIIAATALHLDLPLVSRDRKVRGAGIHTLW